MYKYIQVLNGKAHWYMEDELTLEELYLHKFNKDDVQFVDVSDMKAIPIIGDRYDPATNTFIGGSQDIAAQELANKN